MPDLPLTVWVSNAQIGASVFLGLAALGVGIASAICLTRNNFGWKPLCFVKSFTTRAANDVARMCARA